MQVRPLRYYNTIMLYIQAVLASLPHAGLLVLIMMFAIRVNHLP